jgi:hypothetical protein
VGGSFERVEKRQGKGTIGNAGRGVVMIDEALLLMLFCDIRIHGSYLGFKTVGRLNQLRFVRIRSTLVSIDPVRS